MTLRAHKQFWLVAIGVIVVAQFVWDLLVPNGLADWIWYFLPVYLSVQVGNRYFSYGLAAVISLLMLVGLYLSPTGIDFHMALTGRLIGMCAIWLMAVLIAHQKDAQQKLERTDRALRTISECNQVLARATTEAALLRDLCQIIIERGGYRMAWVGFAENDSQKTVRVDASAGCEEGYLEKAGITCSETDERGRGPTGISIRTGETVVCNDFQSDVCTAPWWAEGRKRGYFSSITIPLKHDGRNFGVLVIYAGQRDAFHPTEVALLTELADDLAFGINSLRTRREHEAAEAALLENAEQLKEAQRIAKLGTYVLDFASDKWSSSDLLDGIFGIGPDYDRSVAGWEKLIHPDDRAMMVDHLQNEVVGQKLPFNKQYRILRHRDQAERWVHGLGQLEFDAQGRPVKMIGTIQDITKSKRAMELMVASEIRYRRLFESAKDGILILDATTGRVTDVNPFLTELLGYTYGEFLGKKVWELGFLKDVIANEANFTELQAKEYIRYEDLALEARDGRRIDVEFVSNVYRVNDRKVIQCNIRDNTEHSLAAERLRLSEQSYRRLFEHMSEGMASCQMLFENGKAKDFVYLEVNPRFTELTGLKEVVGKSVSELIPGICEKDPELIETYGRVAATGKPEKFERFVEGLQQWFAVSVFSSRPGFFVALFDVITERKQAEAALTAMAQRNQTILQAASDGIHVLDERGNVVEVNEAFCRMLGYTREEMLRLNVTDWDAQWSPGELLKKIRDLVGQPAATFETRHRHKDGTVREVEINAVGVTLAGKNFLYASARDISERRRAAETQMRLATAVEQATDAIVITDTTGAIIYCNPAFEKSTGYTRAEALGQNPRLLKSGKMEANFYRQMWETLLHGQVWSGRLINKRKDGGLYEEDASITPIRNAAGETTHFVAVKRDVTHEMELENQMRQSQKMQAIGTLAGGIAHDFNNILTILFGYCNLLQFDLAGHAAAQEKLAEILKCGQRAQDLVQQILTFSRQREQERQVIHLEGILKEAMKLLRASLPADIQIETGFASDTPTVLADATQIYQVMMNLGTNALHAMEGRPGKLTVKLEAFQPDEELLQTQPDLRASRYARLTVTDTGHGMDARTQERIFEPFFTTKPIGKGTGLGLAVVHGIMEAHDGVITVASQPGQGTTFQLYFPEQVQDAMLTGMPEDKLPFGHGQKVLMVDDEAALTGIYQRLLKMLKYEGTVTNSPRDAVARVQRNPMQFDLVVTDLTMPEMNGLEVARQIRALRPDLPIILATGYKATVTERQLRAAGICELMEKPISLTALAGVLRKVLGKK